MHHAWGRINKMINFENKLLSWAQFMIANSKRLIEDHTVRASLKAGDEHCRIYLDGETQREVESDH